MIGTDEEKSEKMLARAVSRRGLLRGAGVGAAGLAAAALIGCGSKKKDEKAASSPTSGKTEAPKAAANPYQDPNLPYPFNFPEPAGKTPKAGGTMTVSVSWDVSVMDPTKSAAGGTIVIPNMTYNRLIGFKQGPEMNPYKLEMVPELAESWERTPDGMTYTFKIKQGIKWQNIAPLNGRDFVAADAAAAFQRYQKEGVHQSYWTEVDKIEAVDKATLKITMKKPLVDFITPLASRYQTIFPKELVDDGSIEKKAIGTGPMILKEAAQGSQAVFEKNPNYWQKKVLLDGLVFKIQPDVTTRVAGFRAGQTDYGYALAAKLTDVKNIEKTNPGVQVMIDIPSAGGYGFGMNHQNPKFADERIRQAIALAHDHKAITDVIYEGIGSNLPNTPYVFTHDKAPDMAKGELGKFHKISGDPAEAKKLLEAAGQPNLTIDAIYYTYAAYDEQRPQVLADQFKKAGITLKAQKADYTQFNSQWVGGKLPEATTSGWAAVGFDADTYYYNQVFSKSPGNRWHISDPDIDKWAEAARIELDPAKRKALMLNIWNRDLEKVYRIPATGGLAFEIMQPWMRGIRFGGALGASSYYYDWGAQIANGWLDK